MQRLISFFIILVLVVPQSFGAAKKRITDPDEALDLAREAYLNYDVEEARRLFDEYAELMNKKKREVPRDVEAEMARLVLMENMLSRVEKITVVDSLVVDAEGFFEHYRLSPEAGRLVSGDNVGLPEVEVAFIPENKTELLYAEPDVDGDFILMGADILDDGSVDRPMPLQGEDLNGGGNAEYPFLLSDGLTLYYANDGEGSIGGYDIFLTRRDDDGSFLQAQNIGMPFNSPSDDYLLAIDETTGAGWWASDRNHIPGKLTIYIYEPSDIRVNVDEDDENLISFAKLDDIELTQQGKEEDVERVKSIISSISDTPQVSGIKKPDFEIAVGNTGRIYNSLSDFHSVIARQSMSKALEARAEIQRSQKKLDELREQWRKGNKNQGVAILNLEQHLADMRQRMKEETNRAITEELKTLR